jgi:hypothetical protein
MNDSYDIPSEPRLSNNLHLSRPTPRSRSKNKQRKRLSPTAAATTKCLGLDETVPFDGRNERKQDISLRKICFLDAMHAN